MSHQERSAGTIAREVLRLTEIFKTECGNTVWKKGCSATECEECSEIFLRHVMKALAAAGSPHAPWPIETDGEFSIGDHRRWLAYQLLDSRMSEETAYGIVAFFPGVSDLIRERKGLK